MHQFQVSDLHSAIHPELCDCAMYGQMQISDHLDKHLMQQHHFMSPGNNTSAAGALKPT